MMKFLKLFWAFYKGHPHTVAVDWTKDDAEFFSKFMKSPTGRRFKNNLIAQSCEQDRLATVSLDPKWQCGAATGYRIILAKIDEFTVVPTETGDEYETMADIPARDRFEQNNR